MGFWGRKKIGLALGSGGAKGLAHIGVIRALIENKIHIDYIAGASSGALIGGMYAAFGDIYKIEEFFNKFSYRDLAGLFFDPSSSSGLLKGDKMTKFLDNLLGKINIENLGMPFRAIATDIMTGEPIIIDKGNLALAIRASSSVPIVFKPVKVNDRFLVDGGLSISVPVDVARYMGADVVIAVNLDAVLFLSRNQLIKGKRISITKTPKIVLDLLRNSLARENSKRADFEIIPEIPDVSWNKFVKGGDVVKAGSDATDKIISQILKKI